jgi:imidazolonepropionase-like amidohydrolase
LEDPANIERMKQEGVVEPVERTRVGVPDPKSARSIVRSLKRRGVDFIKVRTVASRETYLAIAKAAKETQLHVAGHVYHLDPEDVLRANQRSIEHFFFPTLNSRSENEREGLFKEFAENGTVVVPTLVTWTNSILVPARTLSKLVEDNLGKLDKRRRYISRELIVDWREQVAERNEPSPIDWADIFPSVLRDLRDMHRAGMKILPGSDAAVVPVFPGFGLHDELELLVSKVGMTPMEVLLRAQQQPAEFFGIEDDLGTVEVGKLADLVLLDSNPLEDIRNTRRVRAVVANGTLYRRVDLDRIVAEIEADMAAQLERVREMERNGELEPIPEVSATTQ